MADYFTQLIKISQKLEQFLQNKYKAEGRGLHEKLSSIQDKIPSSIQKKIRFIATIRNKATHEDVNIAREAIPKIRIAYREVMYTLDPSFRYREIVRKILIVLAVGAVIALGFLVKSYF